MGKYTFTFCLVIIFSLKLFSQRENDFIPILKNKYPSLGSNYRVTHSHISSTSKVLHAYLVQTKNNLDICNLVLSIHTGSDGKLLKINNEFYPTLSLQEEDLKETMDAGKAVISFAQHLNKNSSPTIIENNEEENIVRLQDQFSKDIIIARKAYFHEAKKLRLIWQLNIQVDNDWWDARIDAITGEVIQKINWVSQCKFDHDENHIHTLNCQHKSEKVINTAVPNSYNVFPLLIESPIHGNRDTEVEPFDILASPYGWHDTSGVAGAEFTITKGNNVEAKEDLAANNEATIGAFAEGGPTLDFNFPFTPNVAATVNLNSSLTNLFYWNNIMHDVWYQYGFDEASGNFQTNNYGRGGIQGDRVYADGLDGSGTNNANFGTPPDGTRPRMQMYKWIKNGSNIISPSNVAGSLNAVKASFGQQVFSITNQVVYTTPAEGCSTITNASSVAGKIALVDRGNCEFGTKCLNAQNAGAIAVIVCDNVSGNATAMPAGSNGGAVTIPCMMAPKAKCDSIKLYLNNPFVSVTLTSNSNEFDSSFDNVVIAHEYGHGISTRLTGGAANSSCLHPAIEEQMGEGWSDWFGLMISMKPGHSPTLPRGVGNYLTTQDTLGAGIRPFRYSTSMTINPHTYENIKTLLAPHGVGSVWCAMLWEMTWALIDKYGYSSDLYNGNAGNNKSMNLVIEALKLQPCGPGFIDGRDAILLADQILYNGENQCLIWQAFAKRGLGFSAAQGAAISKSDGIEAFDVPISCSNLIYTITSEEKYAAPGDSIVYDIKLKNIGITALTNISMVDSLVDIVDYVNAPNGSASGQVVNYTPFNLAAGDSIMRSLKVKVKSNAEIELDSITDFVETTTTPFLSKTTNTTKQKWSRSTLDKKNGNFSWYAYNDSVRTAKYLELKNPIIPSDFSFMQFWHRYNTETNWDGGKVQVSTDNKLTWQDLGSQMMLNGYNGYLDDNPNIPAFSGNSNTFVNTTIDLTDYKGQMIYLRFWFHTDAFVGGEGWFIDDIIIHNTISIIPNTIYQINSENKNSLAKAEPPVTLLNCYQVYTANDNGQGSLRRAIGCATNGVQISPVAEISSDTIKLTSTLNIDKSILIGNIDSTAFNILSSHAQSAIVTVNNGHIILLNIHLTKSNPSASPALDNLGATVTLTKGKYVINAASPADAIRNQLGGELIVKEDVVVKKE